MNIILNNTKAKNALQRKLKISSKTETPTITESVMNKWTVDIQIHEFLLLILLRKNTILLTTLLF